MADRATTVAEGFSQNLMLAGYDTDLLRIITNSDYQGEIEKVGSLLDIMDFDKIHEHDYVKGSAPSPDAITENNGKLTIDKKKTFYWADYTIDNFISYIKDPTNTIFTQTAAERNMNKDKYVLGKFASVGAGNRIGTDVTAGTVGIDAAGVVTGTNSVFTAAMVGRGFKADGHTTWYRVKTYSGVNTITIEDDKDDITSAYTGGVIAGSSTYVVEAVTPIVLTPANISQYFGKGKLKLDTAERNGYFAVPTAKRFGVVPAEFEDMITRATGVELHVPEAYTELVKAGFLTRLKGFDLYESNRLVGNNTDGFHMLIGHPGWMTYAEKILQAKMEEDLKGDFGVAYKDLFVYGSKVKDCQRHMAVEIFATFSG